MTNTTRRQMLITAGMSLAAFGAGTQVNGKTTAEGTVLDFSGIPAEIMESEGGWKYLPIDPKKAADDSYALFMEGACHYASFRAIVTNVAQTLLATGNEKDAMYARNYLTFPFYMMVYGQAGLAFYGSLCGAVNGCAAALSVFVPNREDKFAMLRDLAVYHEETPLPIYVPRGTDSEKIMPNPAKSILCHVALKNWANSNKATVDQRVERCKRLTSDMVIRTVELLNEYHTARQKADADVKNFAPLMSLAALTPETQSCVECHSLSQSRNTGVIGRMNCTTCHSDIDMGSECPRGK